MSVIQKINCSAVKTSVYDYAHKVIKTSYTIPMDTFVLRIDKVKTKEFGEVVKCKVLTKGLKAVKQLIGKL